MHYYTTPRFLSLVATIMLLPLGGFELLAQPTPAPPRLRVDDATLPAVLPWSGASRDLVVDPDHPWITPAERSGLRETPRYEPTVAWLRDLVDAAPELDMRSIGRSPEGRDIWMVIASRDQAFDAKALRQSGKPTLLAQAGIHSGEIDGKDAGLMLLRDMTVRATKPELLSEANLLFVPIFSVDGHERFSKYSRINQRGPQAMGWRTTARNLNLNRDYSKLDSPEMRAMIAVIREWQPDLYLDLHVTDGIDYQYDITFGFNREHGYSPRMAAWLERVYQPAVFGALADAGHVPGPLIFAADNSDLSKGIREWTAIPRYSTGYGDACHLPTVLVENHSLKPYDQRVLGTYVLLEASLRTLAAEGPALRAAVAADKKRDSPTVPLDWAHAETPQPFEFLGVQHRRHTSAITGADWIEWLGRPETVTLPYHLDEVVTETVARPPAYYVPPTWPEVIERLHLHGIPLETLNTPREVDVEMYRITDFELARAPFEGHIRVTPTVRVEARRERFAAGSVRVPATGALGDLAVLLLEPRSPDSFFQWGFFYEVLQRTEYIEGYVLEPLITKMLADNPHLERKYRDAVAADPELAGNARQRRDWFYQRTPYYDERHRLYPVAREISAPE